MWEVRAGLSERPGNSATRRTAQQRGAPISQDGHPVGNVLAKPGGAGGGVIFGDYLAGPMPAQSPRTCFRWLVMSAAIAFLSPAKIASRIG